MTTHKGSIDNNL